MRNFEYTKTSSTPLQERALTFLLEGCDAHRWVAAETRQDLAGALRVLQGLEGLGIEERDDRDPVRAGDHQRVVGEAHDLHFSACATPCFNFYIFLLYFYLP